MKTIKVCASRNYDVIIGSGVMKSIGTKVKELTNATKVCIVSDSNVFPIYGDIIAASLSESGLAVAEYVFSAGENSKNGIIYFDLLNNLAENNIGRNDCIIALGGGVVGDLAGFAAATYLRGIPFIQMPTSLLAMVDSSVGGKTAIDLPSGKNLCGAFYQPHLVLCDTDALGTLPADILRDGCAEVIKYSILYDLDLYNHLLEKDIAFDRESVIARCVELKRNVVAEDEFDTGLRMKLNLGHTIGHGIEAGTDYAVSHGKAVSIGMAMIARSAEKNMLCTDRTMTQIHEVLQRFGLPTKTDLSADQLFNAALSDKKRSANTVNLIVPRQIGQCDIIPMPVDALKSFIEAGL